MAEFEISIDNTIRSILEEAKVKIAANIASEGRTASGASAASMSVEVSNGMGVLYGRQAFGTLEVGRRPGKVPVNIIEIIQQWAKDKGINISPIPYIRQASEKWQPKYTPEQRGELAFASSVAFNIANKGTKLYQDGGEETIYTPVINEALDKLSNEVMLKITYYLNN